jgi:hypothetical protein
MMKRLLSIALVLLWFVPVTAQPNRQEKGSITATTSAANLPSVEVSQAVVQNDPDNAVNIFVNGLEIAPGESLTVPCENLDHIAVSSESSTAIVNYIGLRR